MLVRSAVKDCCYLHCCLPTRFIEAEIFDEFIAWLVLAAGQLPNRLNLLTTMTKVLNDDFDTGLLPIELKYYALTTALAY